jgi:hypothetical protein
MRAPPFVAHRPELILDSTSPLTEIDLRAKQAGTSNTFLFNSWGSHLKRLSLARQPTAPSVLQTSRSPVL